MTPENDNLTNDNKASNNNPPAESAMSILEKRLAEIEARKKAAGTSQPSTPETPSTPVQQETQSTPPVQQEIPAALPIQQEAAPHIPVTAPVSITTEAPQTEQNKNVISEQETTPVVHNAAHDHSPEIAAEAGFPVTEPIESESSKTEVNNIEIKNSEVNNFEAIATEDPSKSTTDLFNETIAAHEGMPPVETGTNTFQPNNTEAGNTFTSDSDITGNAVSEPSENQEQANTFSAPNNTVSKLTTEAERDAALGDENSVGNIISGAIAAHEIIPEIMPSQREASEIENNTGNVTASGSTKGETPAPTFDLETEEEVFVETDLSMLSAAELENQITQLLKTDNRKNYRHVIALYREYEVKIAAEKNEALNKFISEGGTADDFEFRQTPERNALEKGMQQMREGRSRDMRQEEEQKQKNLQRKQELIAQLRELVESAETKNSSDKLKTIQDEWKATGPVPQAEAKELWNSYHALLDIFYNNRSIYFELKELDRKRNLNAKLQLIERAEALENNPSINASLQELRNLHEEWKNLGPVPNEQRDVIWEKFIQASEKVHDRKKEFMNSRREQETENLTKKTEVLSRLEQFQNYNTDRINDWRDKTDEIQKFKEEWDAIGLVPKENADAINKQFWGIYKAFFHHKNQFFKALDEQKMQNLKLKTELCEQAEALKDSNDWDDTKEKLIQLQKKWKTIGRVPDKYSDKIWERFRAACNEFFDRRQAESDNKVAEIERLSSEKTTYLEEISEHLEHQKSGTLDELYQMVDKWKSFDTSNQRINTRAEERFFAMMEKYLDTVPELSYDQKNDILFKLQLNKLKGGPDASTKLHQKEQSIRREISQLENDIRTLKTNIEFFAKSKNAEKLREEYQVRTDEANKRIELLQKQLKELRS